MAFMQNNDDGGESGGRFTAFDSGLQSVGCVSSRSHLTPTVANFRRGPGREHHSLRDKPTDGHDSNAGQRSRVMQKNPAQLVCLTANPQMELARKSERLSSDCSARFVDWRQCGKLGQSHTLQFGPCLTFS